MNLAIFRKHAEDAKTLPKFHLSPCCCVPPHRHTLVPLLRASLCCAPRPTASARPPRRHAPPSGQMYGATPPPSCWSRRSAPAPLPVVAPLLVWHLGGAPWTAPPLVGAPFLPVWRLLLTGAPHHAACSKESSARGLRGGGVN